MYIYAICTGTIIVLCSSSTHSIYIMLVISRSYIML